VAYCTADDVYLQTGTSLGSITETDITNMIAESDGKIVEYLKANGYAAPVSSVSLKNASIAFTKAVIVGRLAIELSRPSSYTATGDFSFTTDPNEAKRFTSDAYSAMDTYIATANTSQTLICITPNADDPYLDLR
jgi:hypothetical protein